MQTHVIILAQGTQRRMGEGAMPKQLLPLPACDGAPILGRTLRQLHHLDQNLITLVTWHEIASQIAAYSTSALDVCSLAIPGNSSLKGIHRYLDNQALIVGAPKADRTVVLLGDVVYSWHCLGAIFADASNPNGAPIVFVGTSNIGPGGGELWGVAWNKDGDAVMLAALEHALAKHPPFSEYQPGQLRRWMWSIHPSFQLTSRYRRIDDYTMDVDLPEHIDLLVDVSERAAADDFDHGLAW